MSSHRPMSGHNEQRSGPLWRHLHPVVRLAIIGLLIWFVSAAWEFFDRGGYTGFLLAVVTGLFLMAVAIPSALWRTWRNQQSSHVAFGGRVTSRQWLRGQFDTFTGPCTALVAVVEVLLPLGAVALGMTAIGLVFHFVALGMA